MTGAVTVCGDLCARRPGDTEARGTILIASRPSVGGSTLSRHAGRSSAKPGEPLAFLKDNVGFAGSECLTWPFGQSGKGYSKIQFGGRSTTASHVMCVLCYGDRPNGMEAAHNCGNRLCVNPRHLRWDTALGNHADKKLHGTASLGERNGGATLTNAQAEEVLIAAVKGDRTDKEIAAQYGISAATVFSIATGRKWKFLCPEIPRRNNKRAKIDADSVREIRRMFHDHNLSRTEISRRFGITRQMVGAIISGKSWSWVTP